MRRLAAVVGLAFALAASTYFTGHAQQDDPRFTGKSDTMDAKDIGAGRRSFEPGARSAWHSHDKGQLLFVEQGRMQCFGIGPATDFEDGPKGFGAHSDQERIVESELYRFVHFSYDAVVEVARAR